MNEGLSILFLCGYFAKENEQEVLRQAKGRVEYSANIFQEKLIRGFQETGVRCKVVSAPFIGSYPDKSDLRIFRGFSVPQKQCTYVGFNNIWGIRNFSRAKALKKAIKSFIEEDRAKKLIVVYSVHTPFLEAAVYAKKKDPRIKICLIVPDLPEYMNLSRKISLIYRLGKKYDIKRFKKLNESVDSYMLLTEQMKEKIDIADKPYIVVEGIIDSNIFDRNEQIKRTLKKDERLTYIVYTGAMNQRYGIKDLVEAFETMPEKDFRLVLCGRGDMDQYVSAMAEKDSRILALGQVTADAARDWTLKADVLVNPRADNEEYTKYSFPSKDIEYLTTGNPVVAYVLSGMNKCYSEFVYQVKNSLNGAIYQALTSKEKSIRKNELFRSYATKTLVCKVVIENILLINEWSS